MLLTAVGMTSCGTVASYRLPLTAYDAPRSFAPLAACASNQGLTPIEHSTALNVRFDPATWIQYMIQGEQYNMVIIVGNDVPPDQRPARVSAAKAKGDELFVCAMNGGLPTLQQPPPPSFAPAATN